jgi:serine O-acetyltransferase
LLWKAIETLSVRQEGNATSADCVPCDAARTECFEAERLNQLVGK